MFATRKEARQAGEKYYFTGKPCPHGHTCKRFTSNKQCFDCNSERRREKYQADPAYAEKILANCKGYRERNNEKVCEKSRNYHHERYPNDPAFRKAMCDRKREWRRRKRETDPEWKAKENKKKIARASRQYATNPEYRAKKNRATAAWLLKKRQSDPMFRLGRNMSGSICQSLKARGQSKRKRHWEDIVGFTLQQLKDHLEPQFRPGMTWDNYGPVWHIDHIKPLTKCESFEEAWKLSNLQPLFARENIVKSNKWEPIDQALAA